MEPLTAADPQAIGGFRLRARLGAGAMGHVYLATSPAGRMVAVKVLQPELARDEEFIQRFRVEVDSARLVSGIYTAPVVEAGVDDVPPWLATAFVPGPSLDDVIFRFGPLPAAALWRLAAGLAEALRAIHSVGLVHRDLKPGNVLLAADGPRVIDFGISRAVSEGRLAVTGPVVGTMGYLSPEQAQGHVAGPPSDVFSLGCVLAFAASGVSPFSVGADALPAAAVYRVVQEEPDLSTVPVRVRQLVQACLAKDPALRPDPGQVAAQCAAAAEQLGLSHASFWPSDIAGLLEAQQAALTAELHALRMSFTHAAESLEPDTAQVSLAGLAVPAVPGRHSGRPMAWELPTAPVPVSYAGTPATRYPPSPYPAHPPPTHPPPARASVSRRSLLIGAGAVAAVAGAGAGAWALASHSTAPTPAPTPGGVAAKGGPGTLAWTFHTGQAVTGNPAVANGTVYFGSAADKLYAVNAKTGLRSWSLPVDSVTAAPTVAGGILCVSTAHGDFYAVQAATGTLAWNLSGNRLGYFERNWAASGAQVAVAIGDKTVRMYKAAAGTSLWIATAPDEDGFGQAIAAAGDAVYAVGVLGGLHALQAATGRQLYRSQVLKNNDSPATNLVIRGGTMYLGAKSGPLYALNPANGNLRWAFHPAHGFPGSDPVIADGMVYFTDSTAVLQAVDAATGKLKWSYHTGGKPAAGPAVADGFVYVGNGARLQQLHAKTGKPGWTYTASSGGAFSRTPVIANGMVYVGCDDYSVYAIRG